MINKISVITIAMLVILLQGCSNLSRVEPQYAMPSQALGSEVTPGASRIVFYNTSDPMLYGLDLSDKIDIVLNDKNVGSVRTGEYLILDIEPSQYSMKLTHYDMFEFSNDYTLNVTGEKMFVDVYNQPFSTVFEIKPALPDGFGNNFKSALNREWKDDNSRSR